MNEIDINIIRYVCAVAQYSSFSKAADALFITQPSLSQAIQKLESSLGFTLFARTTRKVTLTEEGTLFVERARPLLEQFDHFQNDISALKKQTVSALNIGLLPTFIELNMHTCIQEYQNLHPEISLQIETHSSQKLLHMLETGKLDAAVCYVSKEWIEENNARFITRILTSSQVNVLMHTDNLLSSRTFIAMSDLTHQTVYTLEKKSALEKEVFNQMKIHQMTPSRTKTSPSFRNMIGTVAMNQGICFHSQNTGTEYIHPPLISIPLIPQIEMYITLIVPQRSVIQTEVKEFSQYFSEHYRMPAEK